MPRVEPRTNLSRRCTRSDLRMKSWRATSPGAAPIRIPQNPSAARLDFRNTRALKLELILISRRQIDIAPLACQGETRYDGRAAARGRAVGRSCMVSPGMTGLLQAASLRRSAAPGPQARP